MILFELLIGLLFAGAMFAVLADRLGVPYPALLACVGVALALVPGAPGVELDPELALALFVAPSLLDAAYDASPRDLRENLASVAGLAVILVLVTVAAVAWAARWVVPEMGMAAAIALGAIVAPPDASAATAMLRKLQPPHRLMIVLEGESMFNDAVSLIIYRLAVAAAMSGAFSGWSVFPVLLVSAGGGVVAGWVLARIQIWLGAHVDDIPVNILLQFVGTFAAWILAEKLGFSAIITVIVFAMTVAKRVGGSIDARRRIASYAVWDVAVMVLNVLAFVLIGLQLRGIASRVHGHEWGVYLACAGAVCAAAVIVRITWVFAYVAGMRWKLRRFGSRDPSLHPTYGGAALASWCGMRGIITLATALALPAGAQGFPHRDIIVFSAFSAVLFTLVLQGFTLRPLMRLLGLQDDGVVEREIAVARAETAKAALRALDRLGEGNSVDILRSEYRVRMQFKDAKAPGGGSADAGLAGLQRKAIHAQRDSLRELRARRMIGDDAFHVVEEEIDLLELTAEIRAEPGLGEGAPQ
jgi:CPA1 family monovalent cation:H+ antiporter